MNDLISIIFRPKKEFQAVRENTVQWLFLFIALLLLTLISQILSFPIAEQLINHSDMFSKLPPEQLEKIKNVTQKMRYVQLISGGFMFIIKILVFTLLVWGGVYAFQGKIKFEQALILVLLVNLVIILGDLVNIGILFARGIENIHSQYDMAKTGLNVLVSKDQTGTGLYTILSYINPFEIWYVILLIIGIRTVTGLSSMSSISITLIIWLLTIAVVATMAVVGEMARAKMGV